MNTQNNLKLHHFLSHVLPVIQLILLILEIILYLVIAFTADDLSVIVECVIVIIISVPLLILVIKILSVKDELSETCYKRVRCYYWISLIINGLTIIVGLLSGDGSGLLSSFIWVIISILILSYYKKRKDLFCTPWNDSEILFCRKCGQQLINGSTFCQNCGEKVN